MTNNILYTHLSTSRKDARSLTPDAQETIRIKAVQAVEAGYKQIEVAQLFGVTRQALGKWVKKYREHGVKGLEAKPRGRPEGGSLVPSQIAQLADIVINKTPDQLNFPHFFWTREAVASLIDREFGLKLSIWTVGRYLKRWGFSPQKPMARFFEKDAKKMKIWLTREYPEIRKMAKKEQARIFWGDEIGIGPGFLNNFSDDSNINLTRGVLPSKADFHMISAVTNQGQLNFLIFKEKITPDLYLFFLRRLIKQSASKVYLIVNGHPSHRTKRVREWAKINDAQIRLIFLPTLAVSGLQSDYSDS